MYREHIAAVANLDAETQSRKLSELLRECPSIKWPDGMPCSLDPKLVIVGVSPGNSPGGTSAVHYVSQPATSIDFSSNFFYPDSRRYWEKVRYLASTFICRKTEAMAETDALLVTSHFNLGVGSAGTASKAAVEEPYVRWVSGLLNKVLRPDLVVLFGLGTILKEPEVSEWWNRHPGLQIDWCSPHAMHPCRIGQRTYQYRHWLVSNALGHAIRVVQWPNHPSRSPFGNMEAWRQSVDAFVAGYDGSA